MYSNTMFCGLAASFIFVSQALASADPQITAAARLAPRATDPSLVGYISQSGTYSDARSCDYPQTVSTSGSYVQCCPTTGACPFYTSCSSNTLLAASATVPCDVDTALTCNTALVFPTAGANSPGSYIACWQKTLGAAAFTMVQSVSSAVSATVSSTAVGGGASSGSTRTSSGSATGTSSSASATRTSSQTASQTSSSMAASSSASRSANAAVAGDAELRGGVIGAIALLAQIFV